MFSTRSLELNTKRSFAFSSILYLQLEFPGLCTAALLPYSKDLISIFLLPFLLVYKVVSFSLSLFADESEIVASFWTEWSRVLLNRAESLLNGQKQQKLARKSVAQWF